MNAAVTEHLSNAEAVFGGGTEGVPGHFVAPYAEAFGIVSGSAPTFTTETALLAGLARGDEIVIDEIAYVVGEVRPDGSGMSTVILEAPT